MNYEKLGVFYLGAHRDAAGATDRAQPLLYDAKDLTTHAVCVGMTGSGKTGLCCVLLEEAAIDGIPAIVIDPKGDLGNLMLAFPGLAAADFRPWVDADEAARKGQSPDEFAAATAAKWRDGLAAWHQPPERIARYRDSVEMAIHTPGSSAGLNIAVLRNFAAPPAAMLDDTDAFRERIQSTVSSLLALLGVDADPIRSREHILLSNILQRSWSEGRDVDIAALIGQIQQPPFTRIGVLDLESFYSAKERFLLAMQLNNLLASPGFQAWMEGDALDVQKLLWTPGGKPRIAIVSIAHLSDTERMFFVTLLLNEVVAWMRRQGGTTSLRALLYMDEVFGYLPPTANPPSKLPMLTLLKQARAFGLGVVLATQNPVDLDYKALSNAGTWFLGRLQTERDKLRVLDGLEGASTAAGKSFDRGRMEATLSGLGNRVFLMNCVHDDEPVLFETRWALSYLRGPITRAQIRELMTAAKPSAAAPTASAAAAVPAPTASIHRADAPTGARPVLPPDVPQVFLPARGEPGRLVWKPALLGTARLHFTSTKPPLDHWRKDAALAMLGDGQMSVWDGAERLDADRVAADAEPAADGAFASLPSPAAQPKSYAAWTKDLAAWLYRESALTLRSCPQAGLVARPGEGEGEFLVRAKQALRERRDLEVAKLRQKYAAKVASLESKLRTARERVAREEEQYKSAKTSSTLGFGTAILGALFGSRKIASAGNIGRAASAARGASRASQQKGDVDRAEENVKVVEEQQAALTAEIEAAIEGIQAAWDDANPLIDSVEIRPKKSDIAVERVALAWTPWRVDESGVAARSW
ncbi:MAG: hypothetical protein HMLKMBBP_01230 [Planctomycetes bacterium]|nr:hypothetical protein [Planctomycetota bacterium]